MVSKMKFSRVTARKISVLLCQVSAVTVILLNVSAAISEFVTRRAQLGGQCFLQLKPAVISSDSYA